MFEIDGCRVGRFATDFHTGSFLITLAPHALVNGLPEGAVLHPHKRTIEVMSGTLFREGAVVKFIVSGTMFWWGPRAVPRVVTPNGEVLYEYSAI